MEPYNPNPTNLNEISETENRLGITIPKVYKDFLVKSNGAYFNNGVLYDIETIEEMYNALEFKEYAPNYLSIGNDNGDYEVVMESNEYAVKIGFLEQGSIGIIEPENWQDFQEWFDEGCSFNFDDAD